MRLSCVVTSLAILGFCGCSDATGSVIGGDAISLSASSASSDAAIDGASGVVPPHRWQDLYQSYFGLGAPASCAAASLCHGAPGDEGAIVSGYVCGMTKDSCWQGMTQIPEAGATMYTPLVASSSTQDPMGTTLWSVLHKSPASGLNNMPLAGGYTFTQDDMTRIAAWIREGAQNN
jgi:hypothetical protein